MNDLKEFVEAVAEMRTAQIQYFKIARSFHEYDIEKKRSQLIKSRQLEQKVDHLIMSLLPKL